MTLTVRGNYRSIAKKERTLKVRKEGEGGEGMGPLDEPLKYLAEWLGLCAEHMPHCPEALASLVYHEDSLAMAP
jgi:hypothetical protein